MKILSRLLIGSLLLLAACSGDNNNVTNESQNASGGNDAFQCFDLEQAQKDALRALPRSCTTDADCKLYDGLQECGCDALARTDADVAAAQKAADDLAAASCTPEPCKGEFTCANGTGGSKTATCNDGMCQATE